jgi:hypothetical protein
MLLEAGRGGVTFCFTLTVVLLLMLGDVEDLVSAYKASGREQKDIDFSLDDQIISAAS